MHTHTHPNTNTYANFMMCYGTKGRREEGKTVKTNNSVKSPVTYDKSQRKLEKHKRKTEERANNPAKPLRAAPTCPPATWRPLLNILLQATRGKEIGMPQRRWRWREARKEWEKEKGKENENENDDMRREIFKWHLLTHSLAAVGEVWGALCVRVEGTA